MMSKPSTSPSSDPSELARMAAKCRKWGLTPYDGRTDDIDITQELFCPNCGHDKPLKLNASKTKVYCINPKQQPPAGEYCEYSYALTAERQLSGGFWSVGFKYPQTRREVIEHRLSACTHALNEIPERREHWRQTLDQKEQELSQRIEGLKAELSALE
ncbi:hypothetical protein K6U51_12035 [Vibrio fluvialis]|nr:hypothetical protein [Vibrio fluvialis]